MSLQRSLNQLFRSFKYAKNAHNDLHRINFTFAQEGKVKCTMPIMEHHLSIRGTLHGGVIATLVDAMGSCVLGTYRNTPFGPATDMSVSFTSTAGLGDTLTITSEVLRRGKSLGFTNVDFHDQNGKLVASGRSTVSLKDSDKVSLESTLNHLSHVHSQTATRL